MPVSIDQLQAFASVDFALAHDTAQDLQVFFISCDEDLARLFVRHVKLQAERSEAFVSRNAELRHQAPRPIIKSGMNNSRIPAAGAGRNITVLFENGNIQLVTGQFPGNGAADAACPDDNHVFSNHFVPQVKYTPLKKELPHQALKKCRCNSSFV